MTKEPDGAEWMRATVRFAPFDGLYETAHFAGSDRIVKDYLGLPAEVTLPVTFQHGVETGQNADPIDIHRPEPLFLALTEESAQAAKRFKPVLRFPHPWLLLPPPRSRLARPRGTLFVGLPSGPSNNRRLFEAIKSLDLPKPWSLLVKAQPVLKPEDLDWWAARGFRVCTAGSPDSPSFYLNQRAELDRHERLALPYMSSIAVFAAAMRKPIVVVPKVRVEWIEHALSLPARNDEVRRIWQKLLGKDADIAQAEAMRLLGAPFLAGKQELRRRLFDAILALEFPLYIRGVRNPVVRRLFTALWKRGLPVPKMLPTPFHAAARKLLYLAGLNRVHLVGGNDFAHYGLAEGEGLVVSVRRSYRVGRKIGVGQGPQQ